MSGPAHGYGESYDGDPIGYGDPFVATPAYIVGGTEFADDGGERVRIAGTLDAVPYVVRIGGVVAEPGVAPNDAGEIEAVVPGGLAVGSHAVEIESVSGSASAGSITIIRRVWRVAEFDLLALGLPVASARAHSPGALLS